MNKVTIKITINKDGELFFYHCHSFSNFLIDNEVSKKLLSSYLHKVDSLINPNHSFFGVFEILASTAFIDNESSLTFKNFKNNLFFVNFVVE